MAESQNEARAQRILDAATELIVHYGYDKTTVSDIAEKAGVSKGAIYLHWASKDELFEALIWREIGRYTDEWLERIEADPEGGTLFGIFKNALIALAASRFMQAIYTRDMRILGDYMRRRGAERIHQRLAMNKEFVNLMQNAGSLRQDVNPDVLAYLLNIIAYGFLTIDQVIPQEQAPPLTNVTEVIFQMLTRAFVPEDGGNSEAGKHIIRGLIQTFHEQQNLP